MSAETEINRVDHRSPHEIITDGCVANGVAQVASCIQAAASKDKRELLSWCLSLAVWNGTADVVEYILDQDSALVDDLSPLGWLTPDRPESIIFPLLVDHG